MNRRKPVATHAPANEHVTVVAHAMERFLKQLVGIAPKRLTIDFVHELILVRASHMFPRAETTLLSGGTHDALYHRYFRELFRISGAQLKDELSKKLRCKVNQIHHVLDTEERELDIMIHLERTKRGTLTKMKKERQR